MGQKPTQVLKELYRQRNHWSGLQKFVSIKQPYQQLTSAENGPWKPHIFKECISIVAHGQGQPQGVLRVSACLPSPFRWVWLFATPWTVAHQALLSMGFSRQECWSGLPRASPGGLPDPGTEPRSLTFPALAGSLYPASTPGAPCTCA